MIGRRAVLTGACALIGASALGAPAVRAATRAQKLTVVLDWLENVNHAALFAARESGAFARHGLDVTLIAPADPSTPPALVAAGQADLGVTLGTHINLLVEKGLPVVRIGSLIDRPMNTIGVTNRDAIHTLADLKGRIVGFPSAGIEEDLMRAMLASAGVQPSDCQAIKLNYQAQQALLSGRVDAAIGIFRNVEALQLDTMGKPPLLFAPEDHGVPAYDELILIAAKRNAADSRLPAFLAALREATAALHADPQGALTTWRAAHPDQDNPTLPRSWDTTLASLAADPAALDGARYLAFQDFCLKHGIISQSRPLADFAITLAA